MKKILTVIAVLNLSVFIIFITCSSASYATEIIEETQVQESAPVITEGPERTGYDFSSLSSFDERMRAKFYTAGELCRMYGIYQTNNLPLYEPAAGQPLNVCVSIHSDCCIAMTYNDVYGFYAISNLEADTAWQKLTSVTNGDHKSDTFYLKTEEWCRKMADDSRGALHFVSDPDDADILLSVCVSYPYYNTYYNDSGSASADGHSCKVTFDAIRLSDYNCYTRWSATKNPEDQVSLSTLSTFAVGYPDISAEDLAGFTDDILRWYGYGAANGTYSSGVKYAQQTLIDRGFLEGSADGSFGPATEAAVKKLQEYYGLETTGVIDTDTMLHIYFRNGGDINSGGNGNDGINFGASSTETAAQEPQAHEEAEEPQVNEEPEPADDDSAADFDTADYGWGWLEPLSESIPDILDSLDGTDCVYEADQRQKEGAITRNSTGYIVEDFQQILNDLGIETEITGKADKETFAALNRLLTAYGMEETDFLDAEIYNRLLFPALIITDEQAAKELADQTGGKGYFSYLKACLYYAQERYYSAMKSFSGSSYGDSNERKQECAQPWPAAGEMWQDKAYHNPLTSLKLVVNNSDDSKGVYFEIYSSDSEAVSALFITGSGSVKTQIKAGTYRIKIATGDEWYGRKEAFGKLGHYEYTLFDNSVDWMDDYKITLEQGYDYSININVAPGQAGGTYTSWEDWMNWIPD